MEAVVVAAVAVVVSAVAVAGTVVVAMRAPLSAWSVCRLVILFPLV